jgi:hypothetical protein
MAVMLDAVVVLHALGVAVGRITTDADYWESARASHDLVETSNSMLISAVTWFEIMRGLTEAQREPLAKWRGHIEIVPVDARVALRAAEIYGSARRSPKVCPKCFAFKEPLHCKVCGNQRSEPQRSNDIVMVATADVTPEVRVLYSWDGGVLKLADDVRNVQIRNPPEPPAQQINLLDGTTDIRKAARERKVKGKQSKKSSR